MARTLGHLCTFALAVSICYGQGAEDADVGESRNESTALGQFGMVLKSESVQSFSDEDFVVTKGVVSASWTSGCRNSLRTTDGDKLCTTQIFGEYTDQMTLEFLYSDASLYRFKRPTLSAIGGRAHPQVRDFSNDVDEKSGEITIRHGCSALSQGELAISHVTMRLQITEDTTVQITWDKRCGSGVHKKIDYGWFTGNGGGDLSKPVSLRDMASSASLPTFGPRTLSTRVYLTLRAGGHSQYFDAPVVSSSAIGRTDADGVGVELRGSNFGGVVLSTSYSVFDVMYSCVGKGVSLVTVSVGIAPFNPVNIQWHKDCGGGLASRINVGTKAPGWNERSGTGDVIRSGEAVGAFQGIGNGTKHPGSTALKHTQRTGTRRFYIWAEESRSGDAADDWEEVGEISAHASDERVAVAGVGGRAAELGVAGLGEHGGKVRGAGVVRVWTRCARRGKVRVRVTVTVRDRLPVEWWFDEVCTRGRARARRGAWRPTAGAVMYVTLAMFGVVMAGWMRHAWMRREKGGAAARVPLRRGWRSV